MQILTSLILVLYSVRVASSATLLEVAKKLNGNKFEKLLSSAGLTDMLSGTGPFTLFVPSDDAFKQLPKGVLKKIKQDKDLLKSVMRYHILSWKLYDREFSNEQRIVTLNDNMKIKINFYGDTMTVDGSKVLHRNQNASNGLIHVIDRFLYQLPSQNALQFLASHQEFTRYVNLFFPVGLDDLLKDGPHTIFAPTNEAFDEIPKVLLVKLIQDREKLIEALKYSMVKGTRFKAGIRNGSMATIEGRFIEVSSKSGQMMLDDTVLDRPDIPVVNGVIHVVSRVLLPPHVYPIK